MVSNTIVKYSKYLGLLNTPGKVSRLVIYIKNSYKL